MRLNWKAWLSCAFLFLLITGIRAQTPQNVLLQWNSVPECTMCEFNVLRSTTAGGPYTKIGTVSSPVFTDNTTLLGVTYHYVVSTLFPGGQSATLNISAPGGIPATATINSAGFGYTNLVGVCPACGLVFQQRQSGPFPPGMTSGGEFPIDDGPGGGSGGVIFCSNADNNNAVFDSIQQCRITVPGTGYTPNFTQAIPSDTWDSGVDRPWNAGSCVAYWTAKNDPSVDPATLCANPLNKGGYSDEVTAIIGVSTATRPHAPLTGGVWK
jgi:hypothetical protein